VESRDLLGKKLVRSWKEKALFPVAEEVRKSFQQRMWNLMLYRMEDWPYEYEFWKKRRGLKYEGKGQACRDD
jgi:hypothetical protein